MERFAETTKGEIDKFIEKLRKKTTTRNGKQESNLNLFKAVLRTQDGILGYLDLVET